jgi:tellurite resistance-related uncharacterized protein
MEKICREHELDKMVNSTNEILDAIILKTRGEDIMLHKKIGVSFSLRNTLDKGDGFMIWMYYADGVYHGRAELKAGSISKKHFHYKRHEEFYVLHGEMLVQLYDEQGKLKSEEQLFAGDSIFIPVETQHRVLTIKEDTGLEIKFIEK